MNSKLNHLRFNRGLYYLLTGFKVMLKTMLIIAMILSVIPLAMTHLNSAQNIVEASGTQPISELAIGDKVVDNSWEWEFRSGSDYSGTGVNKKVVWIVVAKNHYGEDSGVTLLAQELIGSFAMDNSTDRGSEFGHNHWGNSGTTNATRGLRPWLNSNGIHSGEGFYNAFSDVFKAAVNPVTIPNKHWEAGVLYTTGDKVFVPSTTELGDTTNFGSYPVGTIYEYFVGKSNNDRQAKLIGTDKDYWTRSPGSGREDYTRFFSAWYMEFSASNAFNSNFGIRPVLNLKSNTPVSTTPDSNGVYIIGGATTTSPVPTVPTLVSPANGVTVAGTGEVSRITFRWNAVEGADRYQIRIRYSIWEEGRWHESDVVNTNAIAITGFENRGHQLEWAVKAGNSAGQWSDWSPTWSFINNIATQPSLADIGLYDLNDGVFHLQNFDPFRFGPRGNTNWAPVSGCW